MNLEHVIRHLLLLLLFSAFLVVMFFSINNLLGQKTGVSISVVEKKTEPPGITICHHGNGSEPIFLKSFSNLGNGRTFAIPSWINGLTTSNINVFDPMLAM
jgi:hypothetical protein